LMKGRIRFYTVEGPSRLRVGVLRGYAAPPVDTNPPSSDTGNWYFVG